MTGNGKRKEKKKDEDLLKQITAGDEKALDKLLSRYKETVLKKAGSMYLIGGERDDLIQEGMIGLLNAIRTYDPDKEASFAHYADVCITRKMYTAIESSNRQKQLPLNSYVSFFQTIESDSQTALFEVLEDKDGQNPEQVLIDQENVNRLEERIEKELSSFERKVLDLMMAGLEYTQIADVLGKTPKQADNAIQRIRKKLK